MSEHLKFSLIRDIIKENVKSERQNNNLKMTMKDKNVGITTSIIEDLS